MGKVSATPENVKAERGDPFLTFAARYGIVVDGPHILSTTDYLGAPRVANPAVQDRLTKPVTTYEWDDAPDIDAAVNTYRRRLWIGDVDLHDPVYRAYVLHEIAHVICAILWCGRFGLDAPEGWVQLPFERCLLRATGVAFGAWKWAALNVVVAPERGVGRKVEFGAMPRPERMRWWNDAITRCQRVGLLDDQLAPTGRWPDWTRLTAEDVETLVETM